mmetsp:Transcript_39180/g.103659  ORF Transcript_39180/g.103659 Transcript_39180/m.103659 type:complete len:427 (+) Transcript_39180:1470-2750(+)
MLDRRDALHGHPVLLGVAHEVLLRVLVLDAGVVLAQERVHVGEADEDVREVGADPLLVAQLGHVELVARRGGHEAVVRLEQLLERLVVEIDELLEGEEVVAELLGVGLELAHAGEQRLGAVARLLNRLVLHLVVPLLRLGAELGQAVAHAADLLVGHARHDVDLLVHQLEPVHLLEGLAVNRDLGRRAVRRVGVLRHRERRDSAEGHVAAAHSGELLEERVEVLVVSEQLLPLGLAVALLGVLPFELDIALLLGAQVGGRFRFFLLLLVLALIALRVFALVRRHLLLILNLSRQGERGGKRADQVRIRLLLGRRVLVPEGGALLEQILEGVLVLEEGVLSLDLREVAHLQVGTRRLEGLVVLLQRLTHTLGVDFTEVIQSSKILSVLPRAFDHAGHRSALCVHDLAQGLTFNLDFFKFQTIESFDL